MRRIVLLLMAAFLAFVSEARNVSVLDKGWKFHLGDLPCAHEVGFDASTWEDVTVPHDWAIKGPFSRDHDLQKVAVTQNYEKVQTWKTGRTGGLPYIGVGWYRRSFDVPEGKRATLLFGGAMSDARIYVNGKYVGKWPYGYTPFHFDVTEFLNTDGTENIIAVRLENLPFSSRWYPGAGIYRNVHLILTEEVHVPVWGTYITTPSIHKDFAAVRIETKIKGTEGKKIEIKTKIVSPDGKIVTEKSDAGAVGQGQPFVQNFLVENPQLWSPESPALYFAVSEIYADGEIADTYSTRFGIRKIEYITEKGFFLNGQRRKFKGVCNHHDLGPLGSAINTAALRHQISLLKDMGCDAIRTSHNMPAPELVELCDEMGLMMMIEPFDEWDVAKCRNGYHRFFNEDSGDGRTWAERDMENMLHNWRNNPCVVMWSIGNEVPSQCSQDGYRVAKFLQDICHREDPTRPCTCGMDQVSCVLENGFANLIDIPGLNYRTFRYIEAYENLPHGFVLGSETASTVSSRGVYKLPAVKRFSACDKDQQCSAYDLDACSWSNIPDVDFALADDYEWTMGQFVWTGFDYLGEPSPYDKDCWPNHSSMFGIIDLASLPKDRFWLYRSQWNTVDETLYVLPHWNWQEGQEIPVFVYTSYPEAEIFVNGVSYGRKRFAPAVSPCKGLQDESVEDRYRLMWDDVVFEPGELKVVAYDATGAPVCEKAVHTAGRPHHIEIVCSSKFETTDAVLKSDGKDLGYYTVKVVDKDGNLCPFDGRLIRFNVSGSASYRAAANGDPTCLDLFHLPQMHAFNGMLTVIVQSGQTPGDAVLEISAKGLKSCTLPISVR